MSVTQTLVGGIIGFSKYMVVFLLAIIVPLLLVEPLGATAALIVMLVTLSGAAWYGRRKLGLQ